MSPGQVAVTEVWIRGQPASASGRNQGDPSRGLNYCFCGSGAERGVREHRAAHGFGRDAFFRIASRKTLLGAGRISPARHSVGME